MVAVLALRVFVFDTYAIDSGSMTPTLRPGDRLIVHKGGEPAVGDVVVVHGTANWGTPGTDYVKRVVAVAGDHIVCCAADGALLRNGQPIAEPYLAPGEAPSLVPFDVTVPEGRLWLLGDHRSESGDSRSFLGRAGGGLARAEDVVGQVVLRYWPIGRAGAAN